MTFYSVFVNLRKKCALDCCTITILNEINHNSDSLVDIVECLALKICEFESSIVRIMFTVVALGPVTC